ncbi:hypothetical protein JCM10207_006872 [Rhodosporidiobolus poonsookiae]
MNDLTNRTAASVVNLRYGVLGGPASTPTDMVCCQEPAALGKVSDTPRDDLLEQRGEEDEADSVAPQGREVAEAERRGRKGDEAGLEGGPDGLEEEVGDAVEPSGIAERIGGGGGDGRGGLQASIPSIFPSSFTFFVFSVNVGIFFFLGGSDSGSGLDNRLQDGEEEGKFGGGCGRVSPISSRERRSRREASASSATSAWPVLAALFFNMYA